MIKTKEKNIERNYEKINNKIKQASITALFIILSTAFILLLVVRKAHEVSSAKKLVSQSIEFEENKRKAKRLFDKYESKVEKIENLYPTERTIAEFVKQVENTANLSSSSVEFSFDSEKPRKDKNQYSYLSYTIRLVTDMNGLLVFLDRFEKLPFLSSIKLIQTQKLATFDSQGTYILKADVYISEPFSI
jgi:hypothetical protein